MAGFTHPLLALGMALAVLSTCASCSPIDAAAPSEADTDEATAPPLPSIQVVLVWETLLAGDNQARLDYQARLDACTGAGISTTPLDPAQVSKLDTGRIEINLHADRSMVRQTQWTLGFDDADASVAGSCRFRLVEEVDQTAPDDAEGLYLYPAEPADAKMLGAAGGWVELAAGTVAGQPCRRWRREGGAHGPDEEVCIWSGGGSWGFNGEPESLVGCRILPAVHFLTSIPLEAKALQGDGCNVQVESMRIGQARAPVAGGRP